MEIIAPIPGKIDGRRGRPSKLTRKLVEKIYWLAKMGATDKEISEFFEIDEVTLNRWKAHPYFCKSLNECKEYINHRVEKRLLARADGTKVIEKIVERDPTGRVTTRVIEKELPPDVTACIFWLKNRRRDQWRDNPEVGVGNITAITINHVEVNGKANVQIVNQIKAEVENNGKT